MALLTGRSTLAKAERGLLGERILTCTMNRIRSLSAELLPSESAGIRQPEALSETQGMGDRNGSRERDTGGRESTRGNRGRQSGLAQSSRMSEGQRIQRHV